MENEYGEHREFLGQWNFWYDTILVDICQTHKLYNTKIDP